MALANTVRNLSLSLVGQDYHLGEEPWYVVGPEHTKVKLDTDCSGLPYGVFRRAGVRINSKPIPKDWRWTAHGLYLMAQRISRPSRVGDLGFLLTVQGHVYHTFIYVGYDDVVEAGDGTGHVGLRTVEHENRRGAIWGRLNTDIGELTEEDMNDLERRTLFQNRVSHVAASYFFGVLEAQILGDKAQAERLKQERAEEVEKVRVYLGLSKEEALEAVSGGGGLVT